MSGLLFLTSNHDQSLITLFSIAKTFGCDEGSRLFDVKFSTAHLVVAAAKFLQCHFEMSTLRLSYSSA